MTIQDQNNVIVSGSVIIENLLHKVTDYYVFCNSNLNCEAWNITKQTGECAICFPQKCINGQYKLF